MWGETTYAVCAWFAYGIYAQLGASQMKWLFFPLKNKRLDREGVGALPRPMTVPSPHLFDRCVCDRKLLQEPESIPHAGGPL